MKIGVCKKDGRLGLMPMSHCESNRIDKGYPNVREAAAQSPKDIHRDDAEQDMVVQWRGDGSQNKKEGKRLGLISIGQCESKIAD